MLDKAKSFYDKLPKRCLAFLRNVPDQFLFGPRYRLERLAASCDKKLVPSRLYKALIYAREHTEYGKDVIPNDFCPEEAPELLRELPCISSEDLSKNLLHHVSDVFGATNSYRTTTGGTGRSPTSIVLANESYAVEWAHMHTMWSYIGYDRRRHLKLTLRGKRSGRDSLVAYNPLYNELVVNTFKLSYESFPRLWDEAFNQPVRYVHSYPSLLKEFMEYCVYFDKRPKLSGIMLASEGCTVEDKAAFRQFFDCPVLSWYGQSEKVALAYDLAGTNEFRLFTTYGYAHILDPDPHGFGEITATTFSNPALPLFNYRTGDSGRLEVRDDGFYLCDVSGRWGKDFVWMDRTKRIPTASINLHSDIQNEILFYQLIQSAYGRLHIKVLPKKTSRLKSWEILQIVQHEIADKLNDFSVTAEIAPDETHIIKSPRGKMIMLVQNLRPLQT